MKKFFLSLILSTNVLAVTMMPIVFQTAGIEVQAETVQTDDSKEKINSSVNTTDDSKEKANSSVSTDTISSSQTSVESSVNEKSNEDITKETKQKSSDTKTSVIANKDKEVSEKTNSENNSTKESNSKPVKRSITEEDTISGNWGDDTNLRYQWEFNTSTGAMVFKCTPNNPVPGHVSELPWKNGAVDSAKIKTITFETQEYGKPILLTLGLDKYGHGDVSYFFANLPNLTKISGPIELYMLGNMKSMFEGDYSLTDIDFNSWSNSDSKVSSSYQIEDMSNMFSQCRSLKSIDLSGLSDKLEAKVNGLHNMSNMFNGCTALTDVNLNGFYGENVTDLSGMFADCESLKNVDLSGWSDFNSVVPVTTNMFSNCNNLASINLSNTDVDTFSKFSDLQVPNNHLWRWHEGSVSDDDMLIMYKPASFDEMFSQINQFSRAETDLKLVEYVPKIAQLNLTMEKESPMTIGKQAQLSWIVAHTDNSAQGSTAKNITGEINILPDIGFVAKDSLDVEEQDSTGKILNTFTTKLSSGEYVTDDSHAGRVRYTYVLPDLDYGKQYKLSLTGTPWNNSVLIPGTTDSALNSLLIAINYGDNSENSLNAECGGTVSNGMLSFKSVPKELKFNSTKLGINIKDKLISREDKDWKIEINDFRGTNASTMVDETRARQNWELVATVDSFEDSKNQPIPSSVMGIVYVDDKNAIHELSKTETLLNSHEVKNESPELNNIITIKWAEDKGLNTIIHDRNKLKSGETYKTAVNFELRSAP